MAGEWVLGSLQLRVRAWKETLYKLPWNTIKREFLECSWHYPCLSLCVIQYLAPCRTHKPYSSAWYVEQALPYTKLFWDFIFLEI